MGLSLRLPEFHQYPSLAFPYSFVGRRRQVFLRHRPEVGRTSHLCNHGDSDGIYVPVNIPDPLWLDRYSVGSTFRLREELIEVAPVLGFRGPDPVAEFLAAPIDDDDPLEPEKHTLACLLEMARLSIAHRTALVFS